MNFKKSIFLFSIIFLISCDKSNSIKCECEEKPNADFTISQLIEDGKYLEADTFLDQFIKVEAKHALQKYQWKIGLDQNTWDSKSVQLDFGGNYGDIQVTLIGEWTPNKDCFPNDNGIDTVTKIFTIVPNSEAPFYGEYEGYVESAPNDTFLIKIKETGPVAWIENLPNGCNTDEYDLLINTSFRHFFMPEYDPGIPCSLPKGPGDLLDDYKTLIIDYEIWDMDLNEKINDRFIGVKQ